MEFLVPALDDYVVLSRSYFTLELTVKRNNGANLDAANKLWVTNNLAHTIIKQITMRLNGTLISPQTDTYPYKAYFEPLLNYNREHGDTLLKPQRWFTALDHLAQWTANNTDTTCNYGQGHTDYRDLSANHKKALATSIAERSNYLDGKTHTMMFQPHLEAFHAGKVLVPQVEIRMRFYFSSPDFFLKGVALHGRLSEDDVKIRFHLCQLRLHSDVYNSLSEERHNEREIASYLTVRSEIRTFSTQGTQAGFEANNLFQGRIPDRLIVGLLRNEAFSGNVAFNPFSFQKFGVSSIKKIVKGEEHPYETLQLYPQGRHVSVCLQLLRQGVDRIEKLQSWPSYNPGNFRKITANSRIPLHRQCNVDLKGPPHPESLQALSTLLGVGEGRAVTKAM